MTSQQLTQIISGEIDCVIKTLDICRGISLVAPEVDILPMQKRLKAMLNRIRSQLDSLAKAEQAKQVR